MPRRRPPDTAAGYYVLHDFRRIDWTAWRQLSTETRTTVVSEAVSFLESQANVEEGGLGCYSIMGHKADLLVLALRPTMEALDRLERQLNRLEIAAFTERTTSAVGATEASGYTEGARAFFDDDAEADPGLQRYMETRLYPDLPDAEFASFYFMNKRRHPDANWYDLAYEDRAEHIARHGEIGREYAGKVTQMITGTTGFDDWEWGVTLFSDDMIAIKDLLVEMRFDPSTSRFAEFGPFYVGRRFPPASLEAFLAGEAIGPAGPEADDSLAADLDSLDVDLEVPPESHVVLVRTAAEPDAVAAAVDDLRGNFEHYDSHVGTEVSASGDVVSAWTTAQAADTAAGFLEELPGTESVGTGPAGDAEEDPADTTSVRAALEAEGVYAGVPHGEDIHALVLYSSAPGEELRAAVEELTAGFDRYDTHEGTRLYESNDRYAVVSLWETAEAAETASGYLEDLPDVERWSDDDGWSTMGLFYRVKPEHADAFRSTFAAVEELLADMDGHRQTDLYARVEDANDMFIASHWRSREDAMAFFRSDTFRETVQWGRDVLADRPRHVFLA